MRRIALDLLAQAVDMRFERVRRDPGVIPPHLAEQRIAADDPVAGAIEIFEDRGFLFGQTHLLAGAAVNHQLGAGLKRVGPDRQHRIVAMLALPKMRAQPRQEDAEPERLRHIVIGACIEARHRVGLDGGKLAVLLQLLGQRMAQCRVVIDDQDLAKTAHTLSTLLPTHSADCGTNYRFIRPIGGIYPRLRTGAAAKLRIFRRPRTCPTGGRSGRHAPKRLAHRSPVPMILCHTRYPLVEPLIPPSRDSGRAGQAIDAALSALRRGEPVFLYGQGEAVLALAAEFVNEDNLQRLRQVSARPLRAVLTRRRAVALGLARRDALSGAVSIALAPELPAGVIRNLADPAASLGADPPGLGPEPAIAEGAELAAVALAKLAALLPAALVLPLSAAEAALARRRADFARVKTADVLSRR